MLSKTVKNILALALLFGGLTTAYADMKDPNKVTDTFISIGEMAQGFSEHNLPQTQDLIGRKYTIYFDFDVDKGEKLAVNHTFISDKVVYWEVLNGPEKGLTGYDEYIGTNPKDGYYFVEFITGSNKAKFVSMVLDTKREIATAVIGFFPKKDEDNLSMYQRLAQGKSVTASNVTIMNASINKPFTNETPRHDLQSNDLTGTRKLYQYSEKDAYEHVYFNDRTFAWYCVSGNEKGLGDTEFARIIKFEDNFYMIVWVEKVMHVISTITLNFDTMRSSGAMASFSGWDYGEVVNVSSGALIKNLPGLNADSYNLPKKSETKK